MILVCAECNTEFPWDESPSDDLCIYCWSVSYHGCDEETG